MNSCEISLLLLSLPLLSLNSWKDLIGATYQVTTNLNTVQGQYQIDNLLVLRRLPFLLGSQFRMGEDPLRGWYEKSIGLNQQ
jgi:hypothetical protein